MVDSNALMFNGQYLQFCLVAKLILLAAVFAGMSIFECTCYQAMTPKPNIILIIADDLGFNDVSFHGSDQIPTPNIDALAYTGIILNQYYVSPICTPSRSALFSGKHPIHTGMQNNVIYGTTPFGLPLSEKLLPEYLKEADYSTHLVGKWHLGHFSRNYTPTYRGFDSFYGHWTGHKDYYDNTAQEQNPQAWGYDMRRGLEVTYENFGKYTTDVYSDEVIKIIKAHDKREPLFLTVSHTAVHSANPYALLQAPEETIAKFSYIKHIPRRKYAAMVSKMDDSVGDVVEALANAQLLSNSIIVFTSDNGGPAAGFNGNAASNWPLRGVKNTLWEGGVRGAGFLWSPFLNKTSVVSNQLIHIQDWLPTLLGAIGENVSKVEGIDGINLWDALSSGIESPRTELLHNIDDIYGNEGIRHGNWKLLHGTTYNGRWDYWYGPSGHEPETEETNDRASEQSQIPSLSLGDILSSKAGLALETIAYWPFYNASILLKLRNDAMIVCNDPGPNVTACSLMNGDYCLFNIVHDPCEYNNLAPSNPQLVDQLKQLLLQYRATAVPPRNKPKDSRGQPKFWNYTWTNWIDYVELDGNSEIC